MKLNRFTTLGIIFILLAILIFFSNILDVFIRPITQIFLMGSSKGKDVLFFGILGLFLILSQIFEHNCKVKENRIIKKVLSLKFMKIFQRENKFYLKITIILFLTTLILGLIMEIAIRFYLGLEPFTIFVAMVPDATTTSLLHSHIYKSVVGKIITFSFLTVPTEIHTGDSLSTYIPQIANVIIIILPAMFLTMLSSLKGRLAPTHLILIFAFTCGIIGLIDGGFFCTPAIIGIYGMLFVYFDEHNMNYYLGKIFKNKYIVDKSLQNKLASFKEYNLFSTTFLKRIAPHIVLASIILLRISISLIGANTEYYEVYIFDSVDNLNLNSYSITSIEEYNDKPTIVKISPEYNEMELLNNLTKSLDKKCNSFTMSWNFYSYF